MFRPFLVSLLLLLPAALHAACEGSDLRLSLTPEEQVERDRMLAAIPYPVGNHWRAERGGKVIHLIGTMHLGDARLDGPVARLTPLVENAGLLMLEMTRTEEADLQKALAADPTMLTLSGPTLPEMLPEEAWQALATAAKDRGIPAFMAAKFQPWYLSMMLATPPCAMTQLQGKTGLDMKLQEAARAAGVPTRALEPFDTVFRLFNAEPIEDQLEMLRTGALDTQTAEDQFATLFDAYFDEAHADTWVISRLIARRALPEAPQEVDAMMEATESQLLTARNRSWIPVLLAASAETEGPVVAAFGAAHLSGATGILNLLADEGFALTRETF
ncbi:TraB/GumN family protein [Salipiger mangrovisoli]|uniref:TraB/GumN family protein n=1 Tax=Salipiger mangrovisoli TaxID=2865933 RepID=A0ABR9X5Z3_9RHOB|nr:TraB/GumN family protein [Salipiger mangrovisoli]MBE9638883.1 TraB/GumN family protein [Salipiger mangrovisoli]